VSHAAIACAPRRITTIAVGILRGNPFGDATPRFFADLASTLSHALRRPIRILTPLRRLTKTHLVRSAGEVPLHLTFSCLQPRGRRHCGRCNKCAERQRAFRRAGVPDPTPYAP
jgi:7-cyano-7-deazaguanine synthase